MAWILARKNSAAVSLASLLVSRAAAADPLAGDVVAVVRPVARVLPLSLDGLDAIDLGHLGVGQAARGHDAEPRRDPVAAVRLDRPAARGLVEARRGHPRLELDV